MNDILDIESIIKKQKYSFIYNIGTVLIIILLCFIYISFTYKYQTYYTSKGNIKNNTLELLVHINDIKYVKNNNVISLDNITYIYNINKISSETYVDDSYETYKYIYLDIYNLNKIENYVYEVKLKKENKKIIEYIKDYL